MDVAELAQMRNELAFVTPPSFDVELTNACNLRCRFCPREALTRPRGTMTARTMEAVLDHIPPDGDLFFCGLGESLLHPGVVDAVRLGKRRGRRRVGLVTNAALLTPDLTRRLLDAGLDTLQVSFNGITPEVYERVMVGGRMEVALAHVDRALEIGRGRLRVDILFTDTKLNHGERDALVGFWRARGVSEVM
jgi:MoaA/NifB/PqqE/SkfB family radical SAM enzyme